MPETRDEEHEIISGGDKVIATVWWDGEEIQSEPPGYLAVLKEKHFNKVSFADGLEFLKVLPDIYNNGYLSAKRVQE